MKVLFGVINLMHYPHQVGANHYAKQFDRDGHEVLFLSDPFNPLHLLRHKFSAVTKARFRTWRSGGLSFGRSGVAFEPITLVPNYGAFPFSTETMVRLSQACCIPNVRTYCRDRGFDSVDLIWVDNVFYEFLHRKIVSRKTIYRVADDPRDFPRYGKGHIKIHDELIRRSDLVVCVTQDLFDYATGIRGNAPTLLVPNGVEFEHFSQPAENEPVSLRNIKRPRVIFVGAFTPLFDPALIYRLASEMPDLSFVVISPYYPGVRLPKDLPNFHHLGPVPYEDLPAYLRHCDVGLAPLHPKARQATTLPLKAYQYMASGLPFVGTSYNSKDFEAYGRPPGFFPKDFEGIKTDLRNALGLSASERSVFVDYAAAQSWTLRYRQIREVLGMQ